MKKYVLFVAVFICLFFTQNLIANVEVWYYDSMDTNLTEPAWVNHSRQRNIYNHNQKLIEQINQARTESGWENHSKIEHIYDDDGDEIEHSYQRWRDDEWQDFSGYEIIYIQIDGTKLISQMNLLSDFGEGYEIRSIRNYFYNEDLTISEIIYYYKNEGEFLVDAKLVYYYDEHKRITEIVTEVMHEGDIYLPMQRKIFQYDEMDRIVLYEYQNFFDEVWEPSRREIFEYDELGNEVVNATLTYFGDYWFNYFKTENIYNQANQLVETKYYYGDNIIESNLWIDYSKVVYLYNESGKMVYYTSYDAENNWMPKQRGYFEGYGHLSIKEANVADIVNLMVYPNPAADNISFTLGTVLPEKIEIFSSTGARVLESEFREQLDISMLPAGQYIIKIGTQFKKIVKK